MEKIKSSARAVGRPFAVLGAMLSVTMIGVLAMAGSASATPPADPVEDAFGDLQDKVTLYGGLIVALVVAVVILFFGLKFLKKGASKA